jgi:hypothetical protein
MSLTLTQAANVLGVGTQAFREAIDAGPDPNRGPSLDAD